MSPTETPEDLEALAAADRSNPEVLKAQDESPEARGIVDGDDND